MIPSQQSCRLANSDWITEIPKLHIRKESEQRYASVDQFSEDIRRNLVGLPVIARPVTLSCRLSRFVRRNRIAVGLAALIFLTLIGGIITTAIKDLPGSTPIRARLFGWIDRRSSKHGQFCPTCKFIQ